MRNLNKNVIVRANRAGVFHGKLIAKNGDEVTLANVRKLYKWYGACAVEQLAVDGVKRPEGCKFTVAVEEMTILGAIQILPATEKASESIKSVPEWKS